MKSLSVKLKIFFVYFWTFVATQLENIPNNLTPACLKMFWIVFYAYKLNFFLHYNRY